MQYFPLKVILPAEKFTKSNVFSYCSQVVCTFSVLLECCQERDPKINQRHRKVGEEMRNLLR